jgi:TetR/AcrR family transcriptional regulator, cholesterol catabolism regulator
MAAPTRIDEIHRVAIRLFLERGYDATPLSLIAAELGLTKAGLYHHFISKEQLLFDIHLDRMTQSLLPIIERAESERDPAARLDRYLRDYAELMGSDPAIRLLVEESKRLTPEHLEAIQQVWRRGYRVMRRSIEELQRSGRCDGALNPAFAAFAAIGMCAWTLYWFDSDRGEGRGALGADYARIFLRGIGAVERGEVAGDRVAGERDEVAGERSTGEGRS